MEETFFYQDSNIVLSMNSPAEMASMMNKWVAASARVW